MSGAEPMTGPDAALSPCLGSRLEPEARPAAKLDFDEVVALGRALILLGLTGEVLSDHERELIQEAGRRFLDGGAGAVVTPAEWVVITSATQAMNAQARKALPGSYLLMLIDERER